MKKSLKIALLLLVVMLPLTAATSFADFETGFKGFSTAIANSLPFNTIIGQQWSDAFIGTFPHLGIGVSVGATTIPYDSVSPVFDLFSITLPADLSFVVDYGVPLPAYSIDARLGLPVLPMDIGFKFGLLPDDVKILLPDNLSLDYLLIGGDVRYALLKGKLFIPAVSIGAGYNYMRGSLGVNGLFGGVEQTIGEVAGHTISLSDPNLNFNWETSVIDLKIQASMNWLLITPFAGAGASYGTSNAGGGLSSNVLIDGSPITDADIAFINSALGSAAPDLTNQGIAVSSDSTGWAVRVFGGVGLNLTIIRLDAVAMFNLTSRAYGIAANLRMQL